MYAISSGAIVGIAIAAAVVLGALAPNVLMPTKAPSEPMMASQPWRTAASMATR